MRLRLYGLAGALLLTATLAAGCSGGSGPPALGPGPTPTPVPTATPTPGPTATPPGSSVTSVAPNSAVTLAPSTTNGVTSVVGFQTGTLPAGTTASVVPVAGASAPTWDLVFRNTAGSTTPFTVTNLQFALTGLTNPSSQQVTLTDTGTTTQSDGTITQSLRASQAVTTIQNCPFSFMIGTGTLTSYFLCAFAFAVVPNEIYAYSVTGAGGNPTPSPAPSTAATTAPLTTTAQVQSLAVSGIAPPPTFSYAYLGSSSPLANLSLTWGQAGGSGGSGGSGCGSGGSGGCSNIGLPTYWINNNATTGPTALANGQGGSVTIQQFGGLPQSFGCPAYKVNPDGSMSGVALPSSQIIYTSALTFSTAGNVLTSGLEVYGGLVFVNSGTLPTGTYYGLIAPATSCSGTIETPLYNPATKANLGQLAANTPFQVLMGTPSITTPANGRYVIEIFYQ